MFRALVKGFRCNSRGLTAVFPRPVRNQMLHLRSHRETMQAPPAYLFSSISMSWEVKYKHLSYKLWWSKESINRPNALYDIIFAHFRLMKLMAASRVMKITPMNTSITSSIRFSLLHTLNNTCFSLLNFCQYVNMYMILIRILICISLITESWAYFYFINILFYQKNT